MAFNLTPHHACLILLTQLLVAEEELASYSSSTNQGRNYHRGREGSRPPAFSGGG